MLSCSGQHTALQEQEQAAGFAFRKLPSTQHLRNSRIEKPRDHEGFLVKREACAQGYCKRGIGGEREREREPYLQELKKIRCSQNGLLRLVAPSTG